MGAASAKQFAQPDFPSRVERVQIMRKMLILSAVVATALCISVGASAADKPVALKCPVSGGPATKDHSVAYKDGKVYFCCDNCPKKFAADTAKYATKANVQLVTTGQYKQVKCPLSGEAVNPKAHIKVAGVTVEFCCNDCKGKVKEAKKGEKIDLVFSDDAFKKGFEKVKADDSKK
jgi:YHS domain-containing protein